MAGPAIPVNVNVCVPVTDVPGTRGPFTGFSGRNRVREAGSPDEGDGQRARG